MFTRYDIEKQIEDIRKDIPEITSLYDPTHSLHDMLQLFPDYCSSCYRFSESYSALKQVVRVSRTALFSTADAEESETLSELIKAYLDMIAITAVEEFKNGLILGQKIEKLHQKSMDERSEELDDEEEYLDESEWEECEPDITDLEDLERRYYEGEATLDDLVATGEYEIHVKNEFYLDMVTNIEKMRISTIHSFAKEIISNTAITVGVGTDFTTIVGRYDKQRIFDRLFTAFLEEENKRDPVFFNRLPVRIDIFRNMMLDIGKKLYEKGCDIKELDLSAWGTAPAELPFLNDIIEKVVVETEKEYSKLLIDNNSVALAEYIGINQNAANRYMEHFLTNGGFADMVGTWNEVHREQFLGISKLDFLVGNTYLEVKMPLQHLQLDIPDYVKTKKQTPFSSTDRMVKHFQELAGSLVEHQRAILLTCFIYDNPGLQVIERSTNYDEVKQIVDDCVAKGVETWQANFKLTATEVTLEKYVPIKL